MEITGTLKDKQEEIIKILGFDFDTFKNTANFEQGDADSFSKLTPKEAKDVVMKILQLSKFNELEKKCRDEYKVLFDEGARLKAEIEFLEKNIDWEEVDTSPLIARKREIEVESSTLRDTLTLISSQQETVYQVNNLEGTVRKLEALETCPTCKQSVSVEHRGFLIKEYASSISSLRKSIDYNIINKKELYNTSYNTLIAELANINTTLSINKEKKEKLLVLSTNKDIMRSRLEVIKKELEVYKNLIEAFGKNGIPSYIIDNVTPEIEGISNELLSLLNVDFSIEIGMKKELKSGGISDTFDIFIRRGKWIRKYSNYSGGEKFLIDLVLRIALSVILLRRKGCSNSTLILDEGMGALDGINAPKVLSLVQLVQTKYGFKKVLLITHIDSLKDMLENKIEVVKRDDFSEIKI